MEDRKANVLKKFFGDELAQTVIDVAENKSKSLEEQGVRYKTNDGTTTTVAGDATTVVVVEGETPAEATPAVSTGITLEQLTEALNPFTEALQTLGKALAVQQEDIKQLKISDDEKIAAAITPRHPLADKSLRPTESEGNVPEELVKELTKDSKEDDSPVSPYIKDILHAFGGSNNGVQVG